MRCILSCLAVSAAACFFPALNYPQTNPPASGAPTEGRVAEWMPGEHIAPIAKLPFTAKAELEAVNQLVDGTLITHKTYNLIARDQLGRTHNEGRKWIDIATGGEPKIFRVELYDPRSKTRTTIFPETKFVRYWTQTAPPSATDRTASTSKHPPEITRENLGTDTIEGLAVRGTRISQTYAVGALDNDRPITIATESWYSDELKINLLTKRTDPRYGVQTVRVTELRREEPDASMFAVPQDYRVADERVGQQELAQGAAGQGLPPLPKGVAAAGVNGTTVPKCVYCPNPSYSDEARAAKIAGSIVLRVVVSANGRAENVAVMRRLGYGLEEKAIEAVQNWEFQPAVGRDGIAVPVVVPVEVTFRLK
jgi:TonB family protein